MNIKVIHCEDIGYATLKIGVWSHPDADYSQVAVLAEDVNGHVSLLLDPDRAETLSHAFHQAFVESR